MRRPVSPNKDASHPDTLESESRKPNVHPNVSTFIFIDNSAFNIRIYRPKFQYSLF